MSVVIRYSPEKLTEEYGNPHILKSMMSGSFVKIFTDSEILTLEYKSILPDLQVQTLPVPVYGSNKKVLQKKDKSSNKITIGFLGATRAEKGMNKLIPILIFLLIVIRLIKKRIFYIQINKNFKAELTKTVNTICSFEGKNR